MTALHSLCALLQLKRIPLIKASSLWALAKGFSIAITICLGGTIRSLKQALTTHSEEEEKTHSGKTRCPTGQGSDSSKGTQK